MFFLDLLDRHDNCSIVLAARRLTLTFKVTFHSTGTTASIPIDCIPIIAWQGLYKAIAADIRTFYGSSILIARLTGTLIQIELPMLSRSVTISAIVVLIVSAFLAGIVTSQADLAGLI